MGTPHVVAIVGSYRRGGTIDSLTDAALEGCRAEGATVEKVMLIEKAFGYCRNCFACYDDAQSPIGRCCQNDGMHQLLELILSSDGLLLASPVNCGTVTALMKTFIERSTWTACRPTGRFLWLKNLPCSRFETRRRAAVITSAGAIPSYLSPMVLSERQLSGHAAAVFRADLVGRLFVGEVHGRALTPNELRRARALGRRLVAPIPPLQAACSRVRTSLAPLAEVLGTLVWR